MRGWVASGPAGGNSGPGAAGPVAVVGGLMAGQSGTLVPEHELWLGMTIPRTR